MKTRSPSRCAIWLAICIPIGRPTSPTWKRIAENRPCPLTVENFHLANSMISSLTWPRWRAPDEDRAIAVGHRALIGRASSLRKDIERRTRARQLAHVLRNLRCPALFHAQPDHARKCRPPARGVELSGGLAS